MDRISAACGVFSGLGLGWKSIWQILMMGGLVAMIQITQRYLLSDYEYSVLLLHIQGYKTAAIAKVLGRTAKSVDNAKSRLFRHLRAELADSSDS